MSQTAQTAPQDWTHAGVDFQCGSCGWSESCHYFGRAPVFGPRRYTFAAPTYVLIDPFSPVQRRFPVILGGICGHSAAHPPSDPPFQVCVRCSIFYQERYCLKCAETFLPEFPSEVQVKIRRQLTAQTRPPPP
ncbi:cysteine-rich DPF motif domain-containing protein 1-like [Tigriopus californicus]|uniref:cysteine-rich DPF motif domain-containing protein 1-like n=1 Tax=Tigriopus californicus TaxID=6832 RepID=UPI0027D9FFC9|nr:cysteine-rich DPF motif domain-containing protein 1-like [Tigriopus californicus]